MILLDTLNPPPPDQLVADCRAVGAAGCWVYAARRDAAGNNIGIGDWTPGHVAALQGAGLVAPAIIVPGSAPGDAGPMLDAADALGCDPETAFDIETFSLPPPPWLASAVADARARGRRPLRYGDGPVLAGYPIADGDWWSHGAIPVRSGVIFPVPALPAGLVADQYVVGATINGHDYDVSVADPNVFGKGVVDMRLFRDPASGAVFFVSGSLVFHLAEASDEQALIAAGVPQTDVSATFLQQLQDGATALRGPAGPPGPAGPATYVPHDHRSTTDTGTPA